MKKKRNKKGSTIIELLISLVIVGLVVTAVAASATYSIKNTGEAKYRQFAANLAQQVVESARVEKNDIGFPNFKNLVGTGSFCFDTINFSSMSAAPCGVTEVISAGGIDFTRWVVFSNPDADTIQIEVNVEWDDSGNSRSVQVINQLVKPSLGH